MKMGWETQRRFAEAARRHKLWIAAPLAVIVVLVVVLILQHRGDESTQVAAAQPEVAPPAPSAPSPAPTPQPKPEVPAMRVAGPEPVVVEPAKPAPVVEPAKPAPVVEPAKKAPPKKLKKDEGPAKPAGSAAAPVPAPAPVDAAPAPTPEPPKEVEIATLSSATVSAVASDHARQLATCEGGAELHGDVQVSFQIDGQGKVVKSQLYATIKNPVVAGCISHAVQSWKFPKPPSGAAKGVYSVSYQ